MQSADTFTIDVILSYATQGQLSELLYKQKRNDQ